MWKQLVDRAVRTHTAGVLQWLFNMLGVCLQIGLQYQGPGIKPEMGFPA